MEKPTLSDALRYATAVWLTGALVSPILFILYEFMAGHGSGALALVALLLIYGGIFSIPCWLILMVTTHLTNQFGISEAAKKMFLMVVAGVLTYGMFFLMFGGEDFGLGANVALPFFYGICVCIGVWYFNLQRITRSQPAPWKNNA